MKTAKWRLGVALAATIVLAGADAPAQQPAGIHRIGILIPTSASFLSPGSRHFANGCASLAMSKGKTFH